MNSKKSVADEPVSTPVQAKKKEDLMYIGPTIAGVVKHSTVFKGGILPVKASKCIEQFPAMNKLFVPLGDMPAAIKELNKASSATRTIYTQVVSKFV